MHVNFFLLFRSILTAQKHQTRLTNGGTYATSNEEGTQNQINSSPLNNPQLNHYLNFSILSSYNSPHEEDQDQDNDNNHSNIDFGHSILSNSGDDEYNFDRLGPFEKLCSLCDNTTPSNM
jgi:hypothetical protein